MCFRTLRASFFDYDHAGRCMASKERSFNATNGVVTGYGAILSSYSYRYDECNNLTKLTCSVAGSTWSTFYNLFPLLTAMENVLYSMRLKGIRAKAARERAEKELEAVGITAYQYRRFPAHPARLFAAHRLSPSFFSL